jgi:coenzyme F420-reducing hydrogenase gamma subunit
MSRPRVAFFDFTSCEGCQLSKLNLEDDLLGILGLVEIVNFREAMSERSDEYDIAFVEGSLSTPHCIERIHRIRRQAKVLVALGACAHTGGINAIRNRLGVDAVREEVYGKDKYLFPSMPARAIGDVVKVDYVVPGCPMDNRELKLVLSALLTGKRHALPDYAVCVECKARENRCLYDSGNGAGAAPENASPSPGMACLGPVTRAGCEASCPSNGTPCVGCRGLVPEVNLAAAREVMERHKLSLHQIRNRFQMFNGASVRLEERTDE